MEDGFKALKKQKQKHNVFAAAMRLNMTYNCILKAVGGI